MKVLEQLMTKTMTNHCVASLFARCYRSRYIYIYREFTGPGWAKKSEIFDGSGVGKKI